MPLILGLVRPRAGDSPWTALAWRAAMVVVLPAALALVAAYALPWVLAGRNRRPEPRP